MAIPINLKKVDDLQSMITYLPLASREFYISLQGHNMVASNDEDENDDND